MTTTLILSGIVVPILGFVLWYWKRRVSHVDTKQELLSKYEAELHNAIGSSSSRGINDYFDKRLSEIQGARLGQTNSTSQKGPKDKSGT